MKTLGSLLDIAKSISGTAGATLTALVASRVIPLPEGWYGAATSAGVALTGFSVWLTSNRKSITTKANELAADVIAVDPRLAGLVAWAQSVETAPEMDVPLELDPALNEANLDDLPVDDHVGQHEAVEEGDNMRGGRIG